VIVGPLTVSVSNGIASFTLLGDTYSWVVWGVPASVVATPDVMVSVTDGFATLTGGDLNHSFIVFGSPGTEAPGLFLPTVAAGFAFFTLGVTTYSFVVFS
jgi:hypothetical protein